MARRRVPASAGAYDITVDIPGGQRWAERLHADFDAWTLKMATDGPSDSVGILPSFEVIDETDESHAFFRLKWVKYPGSSAWLAAKDVVEEVAAVICPDILERSTAIRLTVEAEHVVGRDVEIEVED